MPSEHRMLVNLRGTPEYERYLLRLVRAAIKEGVDIEPGQLNRLAEIALAAYGDKLGVKPVERIPAPGRRKPKGRK